MNNYERIKKMSEDDLIELLLTFESGNAQYCQSIPQSCDDNCVSCLRAWLRKEV